MGVLDFTDMDVLDGLAMDVLGTGTDVLGTDMDMDAPGSDTDFGGRDMVFIKPLHLSK